MRAKSADAADGLAQTETVCDLIRNLELAPPDAGLHFYDPTNPTTNFHPYSELLAGVMACVESFRAQGVIRSTRVIVPLELNRESIVSLLALIGIGAIPLTIKPEESSASRAAGENLTREVARKYGAERTAGPPLAELPSLDVPSTGVGSQSQQLNAPVPSDLAFVQFTSGTTSFPKGVPVTHRLLLDNLKMILTHDRRNDRDVVASWLPLYHDMGLVGMLMSSLFARHSLILSKPVAFMMAPLDWLTQMLDSGTTATAMPSFGIDYLLRFLRDDDNEAAVGRLDFSRFRGLYIGGDAIHCEGLNEVASRLEPAGFRPEFFTPCYGLAEATLMVASASWRQPAAQVCLPNGRLISPVGPPVGGFTVEILDEGGDLCPDGEEGEIFISGGTLVNGYFESSIPFFDESGRFRTGDLGFLKGGELYISGRALDRIELNGQSFFSADFEQTLQDFEFLRPFGVAVVQHDSKLFVLAELRKIRQTAEESAERREIIADRFLDQFGFKLAAEQVIFVARRQLRRTSSGKLKRKQILQAIKSNTLEEA